MDFEQYNAEQCLSYARIAEAAERYQDMCKAMKRLVQIKTGKSGGKKDELSVEERNLLSVAYKNVVGGKRSSYRTLDSGTFDDVDKKLVEGFKKVVGDEVQKICKEVVELLKVLVKQTKDDIEKMGDSANTDEKKPHETVVFYYKMQGDYYRYLSEIMKGKDDGGDEYNKLTEECYKEAMKVAEDRLAETHPTRLGLALNFSVCYYEILKKPVKACDLAKKAFDAAIEKLDTLNDASYKDSTLIMQLLRDNLTLWTSENNDAAAAGDGDKESANP